MPSVYNSNGKFWTVLMSRIAFVALVSILIIYFMPKSNVPKYDVEVGKPWTMAPVDASFDFGIQKPEEVLQQEKDSVTRLFIPYYNYDDKVSQIQLKRFIAKNKGKEELPRSFVNAVAYRMGEIYSIGIINQADFDRMREDTLASIKVINGKESESRRLNTMLTPMMAYEEFFKDPQMTNAKALLQECDINDYIVPNITYDSLKSQSALDDLLKPLTSYLDIVQSGERIIDRGDIVTEKVKRALDSYTDMMEANMSAKSKRTTMLGRLIFVFLMLGAFTLYLHLFRGDYFEKMRSLAMVYVLIALFPITVSLMVQYDIMSVYVLPMAMPALFIRIFLDSRTAFMAHVTMVLICALPLTGQFDFVITEIMAGVVAIYSLRGLSNRIQIYTSAVYITGAALTVYYSAQLMHPGEEIVLTESRIMQFVFSGILLLLVYPLMFLIEKAFGFTSAVTLYELSDTNRDLLRRLSEVAPGTFQHSTTVGNIAAEIASRIGARSMLVRTGALYHDIGKMENPVFYTENQAGTNPHDRMTPKESAQIIIGHVSEGIKMAEKEGLPDVILDFIRTHHGTGLAKYFYITEQNAHPEEEIDKAPFTYPGVNPFTREQAILMMSDAVEAASRSLTEYTEENITNLVNRIIDSQVNDGFFRECPITFRDISTAKKVLIEKLKSIYHTRITYPELKESPVGIVRGK